METGKSFQLTRGMVWRAIADAAMINVALMLALVISFATVIAFPSLTITSSEPAPVVVEDPAGALKDDPALAAETAAVDEDYTLREQFWNYIRAYAQSSWQLTSVCLIVFFAWGFYTYGRAYRGRYKALIVFQAVTFSFLVYGFVTHYFDEVTVPRRALALAWLLSVALLVTARLWTSIWERVIRPERELQLKKCALGRGRVLVIGGAGYIGSALLPKLLERGYRVRVLDLLLYGDDPIRSMLSHPNLEVIQGDFRHADVVLEAMQDVDSVVHLGAIVGDPACDLDEGVTVDINLRATQMIGQIAKGCGIHRLVFASTCSVYGATDEMLDERSDVSPISLYGRTKLAAEKKLQELARDGFAPTIVRFATIYGLSGRTRMDLVVNLLSAKAKCDGKITVFGGDQWRPFVHVDDAAAAVSAVIEAPLHAVGNKVFNVGSNEQNYTISDVGEMIHEEVPQAELICSPTDTDKRNYRVNFDRIHHQLGFSPLWTVRDGIRQVIDAIADGSIPDYRDPRYSNALSLGGGRVREIRENWLDEVVRGSSSEEVSV